MVCNEGALASKSKGLGWYCWLRIRNVSYPPIVMFTILRVDGWCPGKFGGRGCRGRERHSESPHQWNPQPWRARVRLTLQLVLLLQWSIHQPQSICYYQLKLTLAPHISSSLPSSTEPSPSPSVEGSGLLSLPWEMVARIASHLPAQCVITVLPQVSLRQLSMLEKCCGLSQTCTNFDCMCCAFNSVWLK